MKAHPFRELRVNIEMTATASDDRYLTLDILKALRSLLRREWFQRGSYRNGLVVDVGPVKIRLTFKNRYEGGRWIVESPAEGVTHMKEE